VPAIDLPLESLLTYSGRNPRPSDFDSFWTRSLQELDRTEPNAVLERARLECEFADAYHLWFTGIGGERIHSKLLVPKIEGKCRAVLQFHGYTGHSGEWVDKLSYVANGFVVAAMDCRGQAGLSEDLGGTRGNTYSGQIIRGLNEGPEKLLFRKIFLDTAQLARVVMAMDEVDENRVGVMGGSQGGALALVCGALEPRVRKVAAWHPFLCDFKRIWELDFGGSAYGEIKNYFRMFDPRHEKEDETFTKLGYLDVQNFAPMIEGDVLFATGLMDNTTPPSSCFAAFNKIRHKLPPLIYPDFTHEHLPGLPDLIYEFMGSL
jgi:cephalosporin-C deacetylase